MKKDYIPQPIDTSDIELPEELNPLLEAMAKNVHEVWAQTRIAQGWQYGPERNDAEKRHPMLIPYEDLPEEERVYDRNTSVETLKLIVKLGFEIRHR
jgi:ryanodine receptor 2